MIIPRGLHLRMEFSFTLDRIDSAATWFLQHAGNATVFAFHGDMGAGKTTLIHALCLQLGVTDVVSSPTFSIINEYEAGNEPVFHIDLYRLRDEAEAMQAGVEDCLYSGRRCFVEWPERAPGIFPVDSLHVYVTVTESTERKLRIERN